VTPHIVKFTARLIVAALLAAGSAAPGFAQSETIEYYGLDALGSVRVIFDQQGNVVDRMDYGPFGENLRAAIKFPTQQFAQLTRDAESGSDYGEARNYFAGKGRFNTSDPIYDGLFYPQKWNRYSYGLNNPLSFIDPSGLDPEGCTPVWNSETDAWNFDGCSSDGQREADDVSSGTAAFFYHSWYCFMTGCGSSEGGAGGKGKNETPVVTVVNGLPDSIPGPEVRNPVEPFPARGIGDAPWVPNSAWPSCRNLVVEGNAGNIKFGSDGLGDVYYDIQMKGGAVGVFAITEHFTRVNGRRESNVKGTLAKPFRKHRTPHGTQFLLKPGSRFVINATFFGGTGSAWFTASGSATCIVP
jgi:RHS repeat-associated protein